VDLTFILPAPQLRSLETALGLLQRAADRYRRGGLTHGCSWVQQKVAGAQPARTRRRGTGLEWGPTEKQQEADRHAALARHRSGAGPSRGAAASSR